MRRWRWRGVSVLAAVAGCCWLFGVSAAVAPASTDYTWSGVADAQSTDVWSANNNWVGDVAPTGSVGTLAFPAVALPVDASVEESADDTVGISANALSIDDGTPYTIFSAGSGPITLGAGGVTATTSSSTFSPPEVDLPLVLSAPQTWSIDGGPAGQGEVIFDGSVTGTGDALGVQLTNEGFLTLGLGLQQSSTGDTEVGPVSVAGGVTADTGLAAAANGAVEVAAGAALNATDGNAIDLRDAALFGIGTVGSVSSTGGLVVAGEPLGALTVDGSLTLDAASAVQFAIADGGTLAGFDYSQLSAAGNIDLGGATLDLASSDPSGTCPETAPGAVATLLTTTGTVTGTFAGVANGAVVTLDCTGSPAPKVAISYTPSAVTATELPVPTQARLAANPTSPAAGQPVVLTATVSSTVGSPAGTIAFDSDGAPIAGCGAVAVSAGGAVCDTTFAQPGAHSLTATFSPADPTLLAASSSSPLALTVAASPGATLTVVIAGSGAGSVGGLGIACPSACSAPYPVGAAITLTATPGAGSVFDGWSGGGCSGTGVCVATLSASQTVTATFAQTQRAMAPPPPSCTLRTAYVRRARTSGGPGAIGVRVRCNAAGSVRLSGTVTLTRRRSRAHSTVALAAVSRTVAAQRAVVLRLAVPQTVLAWIARGGSALAVLRLAAHDGAGTGHAHASVSPLAP